ncbi:LPXTG cell wall anchor domain-containing protein [Paenibacillus vini]|uniref:LPXTG cell wall anchor domain-containing protein n=1 Tax=Paenibacillus TaxID=44249 RepID=UPI00338E47CD
MDSSEPPSPDASPNNTTTSEEQEGEVKVQQLPKTGENSSMPFYILGSAITALGLIFRKIARKN